MRYKEIYVEDQLLDLGTADVNVPISYQLVDIKDLSTRKGSSSKTITIPRTAVNDKILGIAFDVNGQNGFNKFRNHKIVIKENTEVILDGLMRLTDVTIETISFFCFADLSKLKNLFGERTLNDLNLSDLDHLYNESIFDTWDGVYPSGVDPDYFYPMIDYGQFRGRSPGNDPENPDVFITDMYPGVYLYRIIRQICLDNGYSLKTNFFDNPIYSKILIPFTNDEFIHSTVGSLELDGFWGSNEAYEIMDGTTGSETIAIPVEEYDALDQFDPVTYEYIAANTQTVVIRLDFYWNIINNGANIVPAELSVEKYDGLTWTSIGVRPLEGPTFDPSGFDRLYYEQVVSLGAGEGLRLVINKTDTCDLTVYVPQFIIDPAAGGKTIDVGEFVQLAPNLPPMKQADLFKACYQMFNWLINVDDVRGEVTIETFVDYYANGDQLDMSNKLVVNPLPVVKYLSTDFYSKYDFKFKTDPTDYYLLKYNSRQVNSTGLNYGDGKYYIVEEGEAKLIGLVPFAPTIVEGSFLGDLSSIDLPTMITDSEPLVKNTAHEPRILINAGLVAINKLSPTVTNLYVEGIGSVTHIPLCYFQKKIYNTSIDAIDFNLAFETPAGVGLTLGNLINTFYADTLASIGVSAQVTAYFQLTGKDVSNINFNDTWFVDYFNAVFRLNKIVDYLAGSDEPTRVELIKVGVPSATYEYGG